MGAGAEKGRPRDRAAAGTDVGLQGLPAAKAVPCTCPLRGGLERRRGAASGGAESSVLWGAGYRDSYLQVLRLLYA